MILHPTPFLIHICSSRAQLWSSFVTYFILFFDGTLILKNLAAKTASEYWLHVVDVPIHSENSASKTGSFFHLGMCPPDIAPVLFICFCFNKSNSPLIKQQWL